MDIKGLFKNKKTLLPILLGIAIIVVATIAFVLIAHNNHKDKRVKVINFAKRENTVEIEDNEVKNTTTNEVENTTEDPDGDGDGDDEDEDIDFGIAKEYQNAAKAFVKALVNDDKMKEFVEGEFFDPKAVVVYNSISDESEFMNIYSSLNDDDTAIKDDVQEIIDGFLYLPDDQNEIKITSMQEPEKSDKDENISFLRFSVDLNGEEQTIIFAFYTNIVIFVADGTGNSILDSSVF